MNGFLLDTNVLSEFSRTGEASQRVKEWIRNAPHESLYASVLIVAEIRRGIALLPSGKRRSRLKEWLERELLESFETRLLPVTRLIADRWAALSAQAQLRGRPLAVADGLIAATALEHDLTLVTRNVRDFAGTGAAVFNPWEP